MFESEAHGHGKYVAAGAVLGFGLAVGLYYAVQYKLHEIAKDYALDLVEQGKDFVLKSSEKVVPLSHPPVGDVKHA